jgi:hypothetical protein
LGGTPAGSQGYIQFNSSSSFGASANLFWDSTNNRLGVGTSSPLTQLDVSGANTNGTFRVFDQSGSGNTRAIIKSGASQTANLTEWQNNSGVVQASMSASGILNSQAVTLSGTTSGSVTLQTPATGSAVTWVFPDSQGSSGQFLQTDGAGNLSWQSALSSSSTLNASNVTTGELDVANGGTGASSYTANSVLLGNNTSAFQTVAPGAAGNYLRSNGTTWVASTIQASDLTNIAASNMTVVNTRRTCMIVVGADNGAVLGNTDIAPLGQQCYVPFAATIVEINVRADNGTPSVVVQRRRGASTTAVLLSATLATASSGGAACAMSAVSQTCIDGTTSSGSVTLSNMTLNAGDWIETSSATAGGTAKRMSIAVVYTVN